MTTSSFMGAILLLSNFVNSFNRSNILKLHVISSNHLDCGFTGYISEVVNSYFDKWYSNVLDIGNDIAVEANNASSFSWTYTTQPWLISLFFDCPKYANIHCPNTTIKKQVLSQIASQQIVWQSFPFNSNIELYDRSTLEFGLYLTSRLVDKYNLSTTSHKSYVLSQRDVPGMTRSIIPSLIKYNISAMSIGVNGDSAPPVVPNNIFIWNDPISNTSILTLLHKNGYGGIGVDDVVIIDNFTEAIVFAWNNDNQGPYSWHQILEGWTLLNQEFPNAEIFGSTFEAYIDALMSRPDLLGKLPIMTKEMGDTWTYGSSSDPLKTAQTRIMQRLRTECLEINKQCSLQSDVFFNFSRFVLKCGEHTFGLTSGYLKANQSLYAWSNPQLTAAYNNSDMLYEMGSWDEQRAFCVDYPLQALSQSNDKYELKLYDDILNEFEVITNPQIPSFDDYILIQNVSQIFNINMSYNNKQYSIQFNSSTGALSLLYNKATNVNYIGLSEINNMPVGFGLFEYITRTEADFEEFFLKNYSYHPEEGCISDFCKNKLETYANWTQHLNVVGSLRNLFKHKKMDRFIVEIDMGNEQNYLFNNYGVPQIMYNVIDFSTIFNVTNNTKNNDINDFVDGFSMQYYVINKTKTRIPETLFLTFNPSRKCKEILVTKIDELIDINNVIVNGTFHLHSVGVNGIVECDNFKIQPIDASLSAFVPNGYNERTSFSTPLYTKSDLSKGFSIILSNNIWNTNCPLWYPYRENDANITFRFNVLLF